MGVFEIFAVVAICIGFTGIIMIAAWSVNERAARHERAKEERKRMEAEDGPA